MKIMRIPKNSNRYILIRGGGGGGERERERGEKGLGGFNEHFFLKKINDSYVRKTSTIIS